MPHSRKNSPRDSPCTWFAILLQTNHNLLNWQVPCTRWQGLTGTNMCKYLPTTYYLVMNIISSNKKKVLIPPAIHRLILVVSWCLGQRILESPLLILEDKWPLYSPWYLESKSSKRCFFFANLYKEWWRDATRKTELSLIDKIELGRVYQQVTGIDILSPKLSFSIRKGMYQRKDAVGTCHA